jgi:hypothetical protein
MGRDLGCARGFYEMLVPVYQSEQPGSALSLAVLAVATGIQQLWQTGSDGFVSSQPLYVTAVARLRLALEDDFERPQVATVLAVSTLQMYENLGAMYGLHSPTPVHHNGAVNLLAFSESGCGGVVGGYMRRFVFHMKVSAALRQKTHVQQEAMHLMHSMQGAFAPDNPSAGLDMIGADVAELQATFLHAKAESSYSFSWPETRSRCLEEAKRIDERLLVWAASVPLHWHPTRLISGRDMDSSIPTYDGICEVYPSCQIVSIWNLWRTQRLILVKTALACLDAELHDEHAALSPKRLIALFADFETHKLRLQELVDAVCHTVPFHIGNRTEASNLRDFTNPALLLPSHHSLTSFKTATSPTRPPNTRTYISENEHRQHMIARGHSQIIGPLTNLITTFSEDDGVLLAGYLRVGQLDWIREQFVRVALMLSLPAAREACGCKGRGEFDNRMFWALGEGKVEKLARRVRDGAVFMSGL